MAKKKNKENIVPMEQELIAVSEPLVITESVIKDEKTIIEEERRKKNTLELMTLEELVYAEKASRLVCQKYENTVKNYDGSFQQNTIEYEKFKKINTIHQNILNKIENKLLEL